MNDHVLALLYLVLGTVMVLLNCVEKHTGRGLFARMLSFIAAIYFYVSAAIVVFYR
jgi:hypothetical protein